MSVTVYFEYRKKKEGTPNAWIKTADQVIDNPGYLDPSEFFQEITALDPETAYEYRAACYDGEQTSYSGISEFSTTKDVSEADPGYATATGRAVTVIARKKQEIPAAPATATAPGQAVTVKAGIGIKNVTTPAEATARGSDTKTTAAKKIMIAAEPGAATARGQDQRIKAARKVTVYAVTGAATARGQETTLSAGKAVKIKTDYAESQAAGLAVKPIAKRKHLVRGSPATAAARGKQTVPIYCKSVTIIADPATAAATGQEITATAKKKITVSAIPATAAARGTQVTIKAKIRQAILAEPCQATARGYAITIKISRGIIIPGNPAAATASGRLVSTVTRKAVRITAAPATATAAAPLARIIANVTVIKELTPGSAAARGLDTRIRSNKQVIKEGLPGVATARGQEITTIAKKAIRIQAATATATARAPEVFAGIPVTGVIARPKSLTLKVGDFAALDYRITPDSATIKTVTWESSDETIATVTENGILKAIKAGTATITITTDHHGFIDTCTITAEVTAYEPEPFTAVTILDKDFQEEEEILNSIVLGLTISKALGGNDQLAFAIPFASTAASAITEGCYFEATGQKYYLEKAKQKRGRDGNAILEITATHIFFEPENLTAGEEVQETGKILPLLRDLLGPHGITVIGADATHELYDIERYVSYAADDKIIDCIKRIFQPWFATYRLDNQSLIVIPNTGVLPNQGIEFSYAETNEQIEREVDYSDVTTKLIAVGGTPEGASEPIRAEIDAPEVAEKYRIARQKTLNFSGVTQQTSLDYLANCYMDHKKRPRVTYRIAAVELQHISGIEAEYPGRNFEIKLGEKVTVTDPEFGIAENTVIQSYTYRPLEPWTASSLVVGELKPYSLTFTEPNRTGKTTPTGGYSEGPDPGDPGDPGGTGGNLYGIISSENPDNNQGEENWLWIKY